MAKGDGQRLEKLYIELGLDLSKLQTDILAADKTVTENLGRLNREKNVIKLRMEADIASLDRVKDAAKILEIQEKALNQQLALQKDRMHILEAAYRQVASNANATAVAVNKAEQAFLREKIAVGQLERQLKELASQKVNPAPVNGLLSGYQGIKGNVTGKLNELSNAFSQLQGATSSADSAITATLGVIGSIPHPVGKAVAALASIPVVIKGIENSLLDLAKPAIAAGDAFYVMSRGMQLSVADMAKLSTIAKVTGIDINEVNNSLRRFSMQMSKADEGSSLAVQTLKRYGAELYDENGRLKNAVGLAGELGKALKAAEAEGNGAAFRDIVGGKFWSGDFVTFLEDFADNAEAAAKIVKNGLANPKLAHEVQGNINAMNTQAGQLNATFSSSLMPVVNEIVPRTTERLGELTKVIAENKENIKFLGEVLATPIRLMNELTDGVISLSRAMDEAKDEGTLFGQVLQELGEKRDDLSALLNVAPMTGLIAMNFPAPGVTDLAVNAYRGEIEEFKRSQAEMAKAAKARNDELNARQANTRALNKQTLEQQQKIEEALAASEENRLKNTQEAEDIIYKLRHSGYEKSLLDIEHWKEKQLESIEELKQAAKDSQLDPSSFVLEEISVYESANAKRLQLEEEKERKLAEIRERIAAADRTELENRIADIEKEKESWIQAGMEKAEAEGLAQKQLSDYVTNAQKDLNSQLQALYQTELENRLDQIEKERQAWIDKCGDEVKATQKAEQEKFDAQRNAAMNVIKQQAKEYEAFQKGGLAGLQAYKMADLARQGVNLSYFSMTPQQLQQFQQAYQLAEKGLMPQFMTETDKAMYREQMQQSYQPIKDKFDAENYAIVNGIKTTMSEALGGVPITLSLDKDINLTLSPNGQRATMRDYETDNNGRIQSMTETKFELPSIVSEVAQSFSEMPSIVQVASDSLNELPVVIQGITIEMPQFEDMNQPLKEVTVRLNDLSSILESFSLPDKNQSAEKRTPVNVNVAVQIQEAHAWDSEHIQELSDRVADKIQPEIISAIGGDSNSY